MAYNEETKRYDEYPRSQFPGSVDGFVNKQDPPATMQPVLAQYQTAWDNMDISTINSIKQSYPDINKYIPVADDFNQMYDGLKAVQQFFKDDVERYIEKVGQYAVGINDSPTLEEKPYTAYSSLKTENIIDEKIKRTENIIDEKIKRYEKIIPVTFEVSKWLGDSAPYIQTVSVSDITEDDTPELVKYYNGDYDTVRIKAYNKAFGIISDGIGDTGNSSVTWQCYKKPAIDITIGLKCFQSQLPETK